MASKLAQLSDSALWVGLGIALFIATKSVSSGLQHMRSLTEIHHPTTPTASCPHSTHTLPANPTRQEDAISLPSLVTLSTTPNIDIAHSATRILCQRFYASAAARRLLLRDLQHGDPEVQHRAKLACRLLVGMGVMEPPEPERRSTAEVMGWRVQEPVGGVTGDGEGAAEGRGGGVEGSEEEIRRRRREAVVVHVPPEWDGDQVAQAVADWANGGSGEEE